MLNDEIKLLTYQSLKRFRSISSIDYITNCTRDERYLINKYRIETMDKMNKMEKENADS